MDEKQLKSKLSEGYIHIRAIVEVVGKPKEYVEETIKGYLKKIKEDKTYIIVNEDLEKAEKQDELYSSFAEIELLLKDPSRIMAFCFDYMPSSVEILAPERLVLKNNDLGSFLNDLQARLHTMNTGILELRERNRFYIRNTAVLLRNFIVVMLSNKPMKAKELMPYLGVREEEIKKVLEILINEGKVKVDKEVYSVIPREAMPKVTKKK